MLCTYLRCLYQNGFENVESSVTIVCVVPSSIIFSWRNSDNEIFVNLNINSFHEMLRIFTFEFMSIIIDLNNLLISNIYNSPCYLYSNI